MATNSVERAEAAGSVYPVSKKTEEPPRPKNETGPTVKEAVNAGSTGREVDNHAKGPTEAGKGGKVNARA